MVDRLRVSGDPVITEDDTTGDVTGDFDTINTERATIGKTVTPASDTDLATFVSNHPGEIIDLAGQTFSPSESLQLASDTTIRNGIIIPPETTNYTNGAIIYTPSGDNVTDATVENIRFTSDRPLLTAIRLENTGGCRIRGCTIQNFAREAIEILGSVVGGESNGYAARVYDCTIENCGLGGTPVVTISNGYVEVSDSSISGNNGDGIYVDSNNVTIANVNSSFNSDGIVAENQQRLKVYGCTLNHNANAIEITDCEEFHVKATHGKVIRGDGVVLDGARRGELEIQLGKVGSQNTGDSTVGHGIVLQETNRTATGNVIQNCMLGIDDAETMVDGIIEKNTTSGNVIKNNHVLDNTGTAYNLNSANGPGNTP